jgi:hypothetical protein
VSRCARAAAKRPRHDRSSRIQAEDAAPNIAELDRDHGFLLFIGS